MLKSDPFIVRDRALQTGQELIPVGSPEWYAWLAGHTRFSFQGKNGHFLAQREKRRNGSFWYAYRRRGGRLGKRYLGKSEELTAEALERAGISLAGHGLLSEPFGSRTDGEPPGDDEPRVARDATEARLDAFLLPLTKFTPPILPAHLLPRPRLARQIQNPLTSISAPSGFGKTTLLNDWKRTCGQPVAWLSLEEGDNDPVRFWHLAAMAFQTIDPTIGKELLNELRGAGSVQIPAVISRLTNELIRTGEARGRLGLVLDDFHHIHNAEVLASIQDWIQRLPPGLQIVILSHTRPPLALGHLRAKGWVTELDAGDLRFTLEEGIRYLQGYPLEPPVAYTDLEKLARHTEGWAAGLTLTALALGRQEDRRRFIDTFSGAHIFLREYFIETVFQRSSPEVQAFLIKTAILKNLTGTLCEAVTGQSGGGEMLQRLWLENMFIVRLEEPGWYRYQDLFAEMLLSQLQARFPEEFAELHQRAARWHREHSAPAEAVYHLLQIGAWEEAAALIEAVALRELEQYGEDSRLLRWLGELPEDIFQHHKTLLFVYLRLAIVALPRQKIEQFMERVEANLARKTALEQTLEEREVLVEIQSLRRAWQGVDALALPRREGGENDARWEVLDGLHLLGQTQGVEPEAWEARIADLLHAAQARQNLFVVLMAGGVYARRLFAHGQLRRSEKLARQVLEQAYVQRDKLPEPASIALTVLSQVHLERNELELAQQYLSQAEEVDPNPTSMNIPVLCAILRARILVAQGEIDAALANLQSIRAVHARRPSGMWTDRDLAALEALTHLRKGDIGAAGSLIDESEDGGETDLILLARAQIWLAKNQPGAAESQLERLVSRAGNAAGFEAPLGARVWLALALFAQHKINPARQAMTEAVRSAAPESMLRPFLECGPACAPLLLLALQTQELTREAQKFIQGLLRTFGYGEGSVQISTTEMETLATAAAISRREQELLHLLSGGRSNREMAAQLCISESTVKTHLGNIYHKLGVNSRLQAIQRAKELKLVP